MSLQSMSGPATGDRTALDRPPANQANIANGHRLSIGAFPCASMLAQGVAVVMLTAGLVAALIGGGLFVAPAIGMAASMLDTPPRRPPVIPPSVPLGAREDWAVWSYVEKINQVWGEDWPLVIEWFEQLEARYPGQPLVRDKLYVAYLEDGKALQKQGNLSGARRRYEQAVRFDPERGVAQGFLADLDPETSAHP